MEPPRLKVEEILLMVIKESIRDFCRGLKKSFSGKDYLRNINQCYKCGKASFFGNTCLQCETENAFGTFNKKSEGSMYD